MKLVNITVYRLAGRICKRNVTIIDRHTKFENVNVLFVGPQAWLQQQPKHNQLL